MPFALPRTIKTYFNAEEYIMTLPIKYASEIKTVPFGGGTMQVENLTPILSPKDREKRKREIEICLFNVFSKYADKNYNA